MYGSEISSHFGMKAISNEPPLGENELRENKISSSLYWAVKQMWPD